MYSPSDPVKSLSVTPHDSPSHDCGTNDMSIDAISALKISPQNPRAILIRWELSETFCFIVGYVYSCDKNVWGRTRYFVMYSTEIGEC